MIALESSTCNTEFGGMTDNVWSGTAQEVRILMGFWQIVADTGEY